MEVFTDSIFPERKIVYAGFWPRVGAYFIDMAITIGPSLVIQYLLYQDYFLAETGSQILLEWLYKALQESGPAQATIGKKAMKLTVSGTNGQRLTFIQATGRYAAEALFSFPVYFLEVFPLHKLLICCIALVFVIIDIVAMRWSGNNQTLHDRMAGTIVLQRYKEAI